MDGLSLTGLDIGAPRMAGSTSRVRGGYDIVAGGADIWGVSDQFHFAYCKTIGDFDISARLESFSIADDYSKAGIMARESLDAGSKHVFNLSFPDNRPRNRNNGGFEFQYRIDDDTASAAIYPREHTSEPPAFPMAFSATWIRLKRIGDCFVSLCRITGGEWKPYSSFALPMETEIYLGFAVTSHNVERAVTAKFRDISGLR